MTDVSLPKKLNKFKRSVVNFEEDIPDATTGWSRRTSPPTPPSEGKSTRFSVSFAEGTSVATMGLSRRPSPPTPPSEGRSKRASVNCTPPPTPPSRGKSRQSSVTRESSQDSKQSGQGAVPLLGLPSARPAERDLLKALGELPANCLVDLDQAFYMLEGGLGSAVNATMLKRFASASRGTLANIGAIENKQKPTKSLKNVANRIMRPGKVMAAQKAVQNLIAGFVRTCSASTEGSVSEAPPDLGDEESLKQWAQKWLKKPREKSSGQDFGPFCALVDHRMRFWQAGQAGRGFIPVTPPMPDSKPLLAGLGSPRGGCRIDVETSSQSPGIVRSPWRPTADGDDFLAGELPPLEESSMLRPLRSRDGNLSSGGSHLGSLYGGSSGMTASTGFESISSGSSRMSHLSRAVFREAHPTSTSSIRGSELLRCPKRFPEPHRQTEGLELSASPEFAYLRNCELAGLLPVTKAWKRFSSDGTVDAADRYLGDADLCVMVETAVSCACNGHAFRNLKLSGNKLTDAGMMKVASMLKGSHSRVAQVEALGVESRPGNLELESLSLASNSALLFRTPELAGCLGQMLSTLPCLRELDLSHLAVRGRTLVGLAQVLGASCPDLRSLKLANCGLGASDQSDIVALASLLLRTTAAACEKLEGGLESLDLGGNFIGRAGFAALGAGLRSPCRLQQVSFAGNCSRRNDNTAGDVSPRLPLSEQAALLRPSSPPEAATDSEQIHADKGFNSLQLFLESLHANCSVTTLDISGCGVCPGTAWVLAEALRGHKQIVHLKLADNPLGEEGLRHVLRMLSANCDKIQSCDLQGHREAEPGSHFVKFRHASPSGTYRLNLRYPQERTVLRALLVLAEGRERCLKYDSKVPKPSVERDAETGRWTVPMQGAYNVTYSPPISELSQQQREERESSRTAMGESQQSSQAAQTRLVYKDQPEQDSGPVNSQNKYKRTATGFGTSSKAHYAPDSSMRRDEGESDSPAPASEQPNSLEVGDGSAEIDADAPVRKSTAPKPEAPRADTNQPVRPKRHTIVHKPSEIIGDLRRGKAEKPAPEEDKSAVVTPGQAGTPEGDWSEVSKLISDSRVGVSSLRFQLVRSLFSQSLNSAEQLRLASACGKELWMSMLQVQMLLEDMQELIPQLASLLAPAIVSRRPQLMLLSRLSKKHLSQVSRRINVGIFFEEGNPTGSYNMDLSDPADYVVAENVLLVNAWESEVARCAGRADVSQTGNGEMLRNEAYNEVPFTYGREWVLPNTGWLRFDYSSTRRPPPDATGMNEVAEMIRQMKTKAIHSTSKLRALRTVSVHIFITTQQCRHLLMCFPGSSDSSSAFDENAARQEAFCILHTRVVDRERMLGPELMYAPVPVKMPEKSSSSMSIPSPSKSPSKKKTADVLSESLTDQLVSVTVQAQKSANSGAPGNPKFKKRGAMAVIDDESKELPRESKTSVAAGSGQKIAQNYFVLAVLQEADQAAMLRRLGYLHLLNPMKPELCRLQCNLSIHEQRRAVEFLVHLAAMETGGRVFAVTQNGKQVSLPASWADKGVPSTPLDFLVSYDAMDAAYVSRASRVTLAEQYTVGFYGAPGKPTG